MAGRAKQGKSRDAHGGRGAGSRSAPGAAKKPAPGTAGKGKKPASAAAKKTSDAKAPASTHRTKNAPVPPAPPAGPFRLGAIAGATPGKWIDTWHERMPGVELRLIPLAGHEQADALIADEVDAALVRLPVDPDGLHTIVLYDEVPVVVCSADSHLTAADELVLADLAGEIVITPRDDVLHTDVAGALAPKFDAPETTEDAVATVAAGVGVVIVPMSLARLHHRKDVAHRPLTDGPLSTVALAWPSARSNAHVEAFIGIVRGRTANSSRA
ncbi:LysR family substrate-binding domain-containing protein [Microbacterium invictum]|uniref:DNA-binding transcriptional LysR family regulator n=1 Tax=Microbacterium invictum TaxID=515415 RepID=A0AA40VMU6_9MICO|nr:MULTISPECIES: LysR family substrate-binding domain-containing protein [Microbacterium]MBB4140207.1 DNA-binding transcriptional LysR family regulator [Microbacterium invictum]